MPWFTKKERRMQVSALTAIFKADFGRFRPVPAVFRPISAVSAVLAAGRYDPIWPIRPDFGRISPIRRESKPIRHESSRIGANRAESARIREKKKKKKTQTRSDARATASDAASRRVGRGCGTLGGSSVLSRLKQTSNGLVSLLFCCKNLFLLSIIYGVCLSFSLLGVYFSKLEISIHLFHSSIGFL